MWRGRGWRDSEKEGGIWPCLRRCLRAKARQLCSSRLPSKSPTTPLGGQDEFPMAPLDKFSDLDLYAFRFDVKTDRPCIALHSWWSQDVDLSSMVHLRDDAAWDRWLDDLHHHGPKNIETGWDVLCVFSSAALLIRFGVDLRCRLFPQVEDPEAIWAPFSHLPINRQAFLRVSQELDIRHTFASQINRGSPVITKITSNSGFERATCKTVQLSQTDEGVWLSNYSLHASD